MKLRPPGLAGRLALVTALLVTLAVAAVSAFSARTMKRLAEAEAASRVELAVAGAREGLRRSTEELLSVARVLAERPTLDRLLRAPRPDSLNPYLATYCDSAVLDGCALVRDGAAVAASGDAIDWAIVLEAAGAQGERFLVSGAAAAPLAGAGATVPGHVEYTAYVVRKMDDAFARSLSERAGIGVEIIDFASFRPGVGPFAVVHSDALASGEPAAARIDAAGVFAASLPVTVSTGETVALLEARLPIAYVMDPVDTATRRILVVAAFIALLATAAGIVIGRQWISGVFRLAEAARRIGAGDLSASIREESGKELGALASTMEEMRRNLIALTSELRRREAEAQAVLGGIVEGVYAVDQERRIRFLNAQAERLLKVSADDVLGRFCGDVLKPVRDAEGRRPCEVSCPIVNARRAGTAQAVERIEPYAGSCRSVVIASSMPADGMQVQVLRDETELEAVRRTRDAVLANISHEFRTPLAAQLASIELLRDGLGTMSPAEQRQLVVTLERGAQRLAWLIDNLLESVRIESGQLAIRRQDVVLADVVSAAVELVGPLLEQRGQRLEVASLDALPTFTGDRQRLTQVFVNLLANAGKFAPAGSTIRIGAEASDDTVSFWVEDEGEGPLEPNTSLLFERFRRSGGEDPDESGLGLGLYIVQSIVERHGGHVSLRRTSDARTRVSVELPRVQGRSARRRAAARDAVGSARAATNEGVR